MVVNNTFFESVRRLCEEGYLSEAIKNVHQMKERGVIVPAKIFDCLLDWCSNKADLAAGRDVYDLVKRSGFESNAFLGRRVIRMFVSCGSLLEANEVFSKLPEPNVFTWSAIILAHVKLGQDPQAIELYHQMQKSNVEPDTHVYVTILKACSSLAALGQGKLIHVCIIERGFEIDVIVGNALINMYAKCGSLVDAHRVFDELQNRDVVTWNAMIGGYVQYGCGQKALQLFWQMLMEGVEIDQITYTSTLKACSGLAALEQGKQIHGFIIERGVGLEISIGNTLIDMYGKCGSLEKARMVFDKMPKRNIVTWSAVIAAYGQHGNAFEALQLFGQMQQAGREPDQIILASVLNTCASIAVLNQGKQIHDYIIERGVEFDVVVGSSLVDMYAKCGSLDDAWRVFAKLQKVNIVTWSALIAGYAQYGRQQDALFILQKMHDEGMEPNQITFVNILRICSNVSTLFEGKLFHDEVIEKGFESDSFIQSTLISMYTNQGRLEDARRVFNELPRQNLVAWNAMLAGYAQHCHGQEAFQLFQQMQVEGITSNENTCLYSLEACATIAALDQGKLIHGHIVERGLQSDVHVGSSLIMMYTKCGSLDDGCNVFNVLPKKSVVTWNAMIAGYTQHSDCKSALEHFQFMQLEGLKPNEATFVSLLSACSHAGQVDAGFHLFKLMTQDHGIAPATNHYECLINLLGRVGCLNDAESLLTAMPFQVNDVGWMSLLSHCRTHGNVEVGRRCFEQWVVLDRRNAAGYILMSNIYIHAGMWQEAEKVENMRKGANAWKKPGKAFIEVENEVHNFSVAVDVQPQSNHIHAKIKRLIARMKEVGYLPSLDLVLQSILDDENELSVELRETEG